MNWRTRSKSKFFFARLFSLALAGGILFMGLATTLTTSAQTTAPAAPSSLTATAITHNKINLTWVDNSANETGFRIRRTEDGVNYHEIANLKTDITAYRDAGVRASTTYTYTVSAYNAIGFSAESNLAWDTTPRPGETEPALNYFEFRDDEVFLTEPRLAYNAHPNSKVFELNTAQTQITLLEEFGYPDLADQHNAMAAVSGHILAHQQETVMQAYRSAAGLEVKGYKQTAASATLLGLADRLPGTTDFFDLAADDLDGLAWQWERRDEVVVAYAQPGSAGSLTTHPIQVAVLDFLSASDTSPSATAVTTATTSLPLEAASILSGAMMPVDNALDVTTGDFDGDGWPEIAVTYLAGPHKLCIDVFNYTATRSGVASINRSLALAGSYCQDLDPARFWAVNLSTAAGDYNGDGYDELAVGTVVTNSSNGNLTKSVWLFQFIGFDSLTMRLVPGIVDLWSGPKSASSGRLQLVSGLFQYNPGTGWDINRSMLAAVYAGSGKTHIRTIEYDTELAASIHPELILNWDARFWLAAGRFKGSVTPTDSNPCWSLALITWDSNQMWTLNILQPAPPAAPVQKLQVQEPTYAAPGYGVRLPLAAMDPDGDSLRLGNPAHYTVQNLVNIHYIMQEPPKHAYWDPALGKVVNVSRMNAFNVALSTSSGTGWGNYSSNSASSSYGKTTDVSAGASASIGGNIGIFTLGAQASFAYSNTLTSEYGRHEDSYNSSYNESSYAFTSETNQDDYIEARIQTYDIWRYRIFGAPDDDPLTYPFMDFVLPASLEPVTSHGPGRGIKWYQPVHENGNILSYPKYSDAMPNDLAPYSLQNGTAYTGLMYGNVQYLYGGASTSPSLQWTQQSGAGSNRSYDQSLSENDSYKVSVNVSVEVPGASLMGNAAYGLGFSTNNSWAQNATATYTTTNSTGITIRQPADSDDKGYAYYPMIYTTRDGVLKTTYQVEPLESNTGWLFWIGKFGQQADFALNLPNRFIPAGVDETGREAWKPNTIDTRKEIRGFFMRILDEEMEDTFDVPGSIVKPEIPVILQVRVYNYSVHNAGTTIPKATQVCFSYVKFSTNPLGESGPREPIGCQPLLNDLAARQMTTVTQPWITPLLDRGVDSQMYRIYVNLDPGDAVDEIYDTEDPALYCILPSTTPCGTPAANYPAQYIDPGQNNEGFSYIRVAAIGYGGPIGGKPGHVGMAKDAIAAIDRKGKLATGTVQAYRYEPLQVRVTITSDTRSLASTYLLLYNGDPDEGGELIGMQEVFTGSDDPAGISVWFDWVPTEIGPHRLYAKVLQSITDSAPGNNIGMLKVIVIPVPPGKTR